MKKEVKNKKAILAFSGGLDTSYCVCYLQELGYEVITVTVDTGVLTEKEKKGIATRAKELGVKKHLTIGVKEAFYNKIVSYIIKGNILRGGVYPLCAGPERTIIAQAVVDVAHKEKSNVIVHGSTGAGNDQIRFDLGIKSLDAKIKILAPIRDLEISREAEIKYLEDRNIHIPLISKSYSINKGVLGTTIGGKETKSTWECPPDSVYEGVTPIEKTPNNPTTLIISFKKGLPFALNNKKMSGSDLLLALDKIGGKNGVGKNIHLGNTILGIKGRVAFSAPAILILIKAHKELEKLILTKAQSFWKDTLSDVYGGFLHEALYFDPVMRDIEAMIDQNQINVEGDVRAKLFKGNIIIEGSRSPYSMLATDIATYGEENKMWTGADATGFAKIYGIQSVLANAVINKNKINKK